MDDQKLLAYLILPGEYSVMKVSIGYGIVSCHSSMSVDPLALRISDSQRSQFNRAMSLLKLAPWVQTELVTKNHPTSDQYTLNTTEPNKTEEQEKTRPQHWVSPEEDIKIQGKSLNMYSTFLG